MSATHRPAGMSDHYRPIAWLKGRVTWAVCRVCNVELRWSTRAAGRHESLEGHRLNACIQGVKECGICAVCLADGEPNVLRRPDQL